MNLLSEPALRMLKLLTPQRCHMPETTFGKGHDIWNELEDFDLIKTGWSNGYSWVHLTPSASPYNPSVFN